MEISGQDYYLDLLFYHLRLRCYVVIDLLCGRSHNKSSVANFIMLCSSNLQRPVWGDELFFAT